MPIVYALAILLASIAALLGLPQALNVAQTQIIDRSLPNNTVYAQNEPSLHSKERSFGFLFKDNENPQVAGAQKVNLTPQNLGLQPPIISATAVLIKDLDGDFLLYIKDPNKRVPIASTTKIMTALVAVNYYQLDNVLTVPDSALVEGSTMGLEAGEQLTFRSLLYGLLLNSGNDAAFTLAANYPGGVPSFIQEMNQQAIELGLLNTYFDNPAGFDSPSHFSSVFDLAKIAEAASQNPSLARIFATQDAIVASIDNQSVHHLKNLNKLLGLPGVLGIKTGTTPAAKENLVTLVQRDEHRILLVVLGSDDRFGETRNLINWTFDNFSWE